MSDLQDIRKAWRNRNLVPFIGSGVSQAAAGLPSWDALLRSGIEYLRKRQKDLKVKATVIKAISDKEKANDLVEGFGLLQHALGGTKSDPYRAFLVDQFGSPKVSNSSRKILDAVRGLGARVVVTTNYDRLLEDYNIVPKESSATWLETREIFTLLRGGQGVIHLHGLWDYPESVILSEQDYRHIVHGPKESIQVSQALFHSGILLFIGCSIAGVNDPHLSTLLGEFAKIQGPLLRAQPHYILFKDDVPSEEMAAALRLGLKPVKYGSEYHDLPNFLRKIPEVPSVRADDVRLVLQTLQGAKSLDEAFSSVRDFVEGVVFPGRKVRIGFAAKTEESGKVFLRNKYLIPAGATHNDFSYPQTLAAWSLIEGRILSVPESLPLVCDFEKLRNMKKAVRIRKALLESSSAHDKKIAEYLDPSKIKRKTAANKLKIEDIYQNWVSKQPMKHYKQFVSVPVPVIDRISNDSKAQEYGVLNIDTQEDEALVTDATTALLKLVSDAVAVAFKMFAGKSGGGV